MRKLLLLCFTIVFSFSLHSSAQVTGSDTVCAGCIYTYSANIPGAVTFTWTVPSGWYELTGQGTSQISVTSNHGGGQVCAEGFDSLGASLGTQCLLTDAGSQDGGSSSHLQPDGSFAICDNISSVPVIPYLVTTLTGGCLLGCNGGIPHPNILWGLYTGQFFMGVLGTQIYCGVGTYYAAYVDTTLGANFPQAISISSGCGGPAGGQFSIFEATLNPFVTQSPFPVCVGDTVTLTGNGINGCFPGQSWFSPSGLTAISADMFSFTAIVTGPASIYFNQCVAYSSAVFMGTCDAYIYFTLNVVTCSASASFQTSNTTVCENTCISFANTSSSATSYQWNFPGASPALSTDTNPSNICYSSAGTYDVTLIAFNAAGNDTLVMPNYIHVLAPPSSSFISSDTDFCTPACINFTNLSLNTSSSQWSFPGAIPATSSINDPQNICYPAAGNFDVTLISSNPGCSDTATIPAFITVYDSPQSLIAATDTSLCTGNCIDFINLSTNANSYEWNFQGAIPATSNSNDPQHICYGTAGNFDVTLISSNPGCSDTTTIPGFISVHVSPQSSMAAVDTALCPGSCTDFINLSTGANSYEWSFNGATVDTSTLENPAGICYNTTGQYDIVLVAFNGICSDTFSIPGYITVYPAPTALAIQQSGDTLITDQGFDTYQWYYNANVIAGATAYSYLATANGDYNVIASDSNGCEVEAAIFNVITNIQPPTSATEFSVFPNPATNGLTIESKNHPIDVISIFNVIGEMVMAFHPAPEVNLLHSELDIHNLSPGLYYIEVGCNHETKRARFFKQ